MPCSPVFILLPLGSIEEMDKRCRAFLWTGKGSCKVKGGFAWDVVLPTRTRSQRPPAAEQVLGTKMVVKLYEPPTTPWQGQGWF